eukprot:3659078-Rhodomonas_salina.1
MPRRLQEPGGTETQPRPHPTVEFDADAAFCKGDKSQEKAVEGAGGAGWLPCRLFPLPLFT